jgi:hypothetical protein
MKALFGVFIGIIIMIFLNDFYGRTDGLQNRGEVNKIAEDYQSRLTEKERRYAAQLERSMHFCEEDKRQAVEVAKNTLRIRLQQQAEQDKAKALSDQQLLLDEKCEGEKGLLQLEIKDMRQWLEQTQEQVYDLEQERGHLQFNQDMMVAAQERLVKHIHYTKSQRIHKQSVIHQMDQHPLMIVGLIMAVTVLLSGTIARIRGTRNRKKWLL